MKKFLLSLFILSAINIVNAQQLLITFSKEKAQFVKDINAFMTSNKMEQNINAMNAFEKAVKDGKVPDAWFEKMAMNCNSMSERNMTPFSHFIPYLTAVMNAAQTKQTDGHYSLGRFYY